MSGQKIITGLQEAIVMTDDLVTRLKDGFAIRTVIGGYAPDIAGTVQIMAEAAARIESDAAKIARLEGERETLWPQELVEEAVRAAQPMLAELADKQEAENLALEARAEAAEAKLAALVKAAQGMSTPIKNVDFETRLEQHGRLFAAVTAAKGAK